MKKKRLSLRTYLAFWLVLMVLLTGAGLIITINTISSILLNNVVPSVHVIDIVPSPTNGQSTVKDNNIGVTEGKVVLEKQRQGLTYNQAVQKALKYLRVISLVSLVVILLLGSLGAYWLSKKALHPVQSLSQTVKRIHANNLAERIPTDGPEDEIKELACSFNTMLSQLEQHINLQRRFISDAAHELRTPLSVMQINLESLQDNPEATREEYREGLSAINRVLPD